MNKETRQFIWGIILVLLASFSMMLFYQDIINDSIINSLVNLVCGVWLGWRGTFLIEKTL